MTYLLTYFVSILVPVYEEYSVAVVILIISPISLLANSYRA